MKVTIIWICYIVITAAGQPVVVREEFKSQEKCFAFGAEVSRQFGAPLGQLNGAAISCVPKEK